ncbi:MAG: tRNA lysidine(34) synthetase TilS [Bacteroidota bacterium]
MKKKLSEYIEKHSMFIQGERILIAASAGVDSTVLCYLFNELKIIFGIAHCNFKLRKAESDKDEYFVKKLAEKFFVPFYSTSFETELFSKKNKLSLQEAARNLRYEWLQKTAYNNNFGKIATAHHLDDNIETILYNFSKSTGIKGIRGILPVKSNIIRPMLFAGKKEILDYASKKNIEYREDQSNLTNKYTRNIIRHNITPVFEAINPSFQKSAGESIEYLRDVEKLFNHAIRRIQINITTLERDAGGENIIVKIDIKKLLAAPAYETVLFEILNNYDFNKSQVKQILKSIHNEPGRFYYSPQKRLLVDREYLIVEQLKELKKSIFIKENPDGQAIRIAGGALALSYAKGPVDKFPKDRNIAFFDADKVDWPLTLRHWESGDYFQPIGMHGRKKKLQDFFTNQKLSRLEKEKVWILESSGSICWIVGHRMDERFKVTAETVRCLVVEFLPGNFVTEKRGRS